MARLLQCCLQNLFRKILFLTEYEPLVKQQGGAQVSADVRKVSAACVWGGGEMGFCIFSE